MDISHLLQQDIIIKPRTGYSEDGLPLRGANTTVKARVQLVTNQERQDGGEYVNIDAKIYTLPQVSLNLGAMIEYDGKDYTVESVTAGVDISGNYNHFMYKVKRVL